MHLALSRLAAISIIAIFVILAVLGAYAVSTMIGSTTITNSSSKSTVTAFSVSNSHTQAAYVGSFFPQNESFQFVEAKSVNGTGSAAEINATFRNNLPSSESILLVGVAYSATVYNSSFAGPICCPIVQSYFANNPTTTSATLSVNGKSVFSSKLGFTSLQSGVYLVKLFIAAQNGTALSPASTMYLQVSSSGSVCGGQEGAGSEFVDPDNGLIYVADSGNDGISVINGTTNKVVATISLPDLIGTLQFYAYDSGNKEIYVGGTNQNEVFAINASSNFLLNRIIVTAPNQSVGSLVYDPANGKIFAINFVYSVVSVINDSTNKIIANITGIEGPTNGVYDPKNGNILVDAYNGTVYAIDGNNYSVVAKVSTNQSNSYYFLYDPDNGLIYTSWGNTIVMINASNDRLLPSTISVNFPSYEPMLYDPSNKNLYVYGNNQLTAISTISANIVANFPVQGVNEGLIQASPFRFYDPFGGNIFVTSLLNPQNGTTALIEIGKTNSILAQTDLPNWPFIDYTGGQIFDPSNGMLYATSGVSSVSIYPINSPAAPTTIQLGTCNVGYLPP
jgi:YVTN family beta-propeller protein